MNRQVKNHMFEKIEKFMENTEASLMNKATELTGFLVVVGLVMVPVGYSAIANINKTAVGITVGSTQDTVLTSILTISLAVIVMGLISAFSKK